MLNLMVNICQAILELLFDYSGVVDVNKKNSYNYIVC